MVEAHCTPYMVHPGATKMYKDITKVYWWNEMKKDISHFVEQCLMCQQVKIENQRPSSMLKPLIIPKWKWKNIVMDFVVGLPLSQHGNDAIWVIMDRLTKSAHFFPIRMTHSMEKLA